MAQIVFKFNLFFWYTVYDLYANETPVITGFLYNLKKLVDSKSRLRLSYKMIPETNLITRR
jgi:hypothetical protein